MYKRKIKMQYYIYIIQLVVNFRAISGEHNVNKAHKAPVTQTLVVINTITNESIYIT